MIGKIIILIVIITFIPFVKAITVIPGSTDIFFEPGIEKNVKIKLINDEGIDLKVIVYAEGDLKDYVRIDNEFFEIDSEEREKIINVKINMPKNIDKPGIHEIKIIIRTIESTTASMKGTNIKAQIALISRINIIVPFPGKYAEIKLLAPNFIKNRKSNFAIEVVNRGKRKILDAYATIDIYTPTNEKIITLVSDSFDVDPNKRKLVSIEWLPKAESGKYRAVATVIYNGRNAVDEKVFYIGSINVSIESISVRNFKLGGIAKFDIVVKNDWNEIMRDVYAEYTIHDEKNIYVEDKTASMNIEARSKTVLHAYWDTEKVDEGDYVLRIVLHFMNTSNVYKYTIHVSRDRIEINAPSGMVIGIEDNSMFKILIYLMIVVIATNILLYLKLGKKK